MFRKSSRPVTANPLPACLWVVRIGAQSTCASPQGGPRSHPVAAPRLHPANVVFDHFPVFIVHLSHMMIPLPQKREVSAGSARATSAPGTPLRRALRGAGARPVTPATQTAYGSLLRMVRQVRVTLRCRRFQGIYGNPVGGGVRRPHLLQCPPKQSTPRLQILCSTLKFRGNLREVLQRRFQIVGDLGSYDIRRGQRVGIRQALVLYPEKVEAELVALKQFLIFVAAPAAFRVSIAPGRCTFIQEFQAIGFSPSRRLSQIRLVTRVFSGAKNPA